MRSLALLVFLAAGCMHEVKPLPPQVAYRITRDSDGAVLIIQSGGESRLQKIKDEFCQGQTCLIETVQLRPERKR